ncbi:MAG: hypothetical protein R2704_13450 [Microthrixaceae bacterium]
MRIGLLMCGRVAPAAQAAGGDYPELFASFFADHDVELVQVDLDRGELPADLDVADGWMTTGSAHSMVADDLPWLDDSLDLVRTLVAEDRPFVGDCFGHQLLGRALGGTVERTSLFRVGVQPYRVTAHQPWMTPTADTFRLIASHQDQVVRPPEGVTVFAEGPECPVAGMAIGSAMSFQGHPEYTPELSHLLTLDRRERIGEEETRQGLASLDRGVTQTMVGDWIVAFFEMMLDRRNRA